MEQAIASIIQGMTEGNFSFLILIVGIAQLVVMICKRGQTNVKKDK